MGRKGRNYSHGGPWAHGRLRVLGVRARCVTCLVCPVLVGWLCTTGRTENLCRTCKALQLCGSWRFGWPALLHCSGGYVVQRVASWCLRLQGKLSLILLQHYQWCWKRVWNCVFLIYSMFVLKAVTVVSCFNLFTGVARMALEDQWLVPAQDVHFFYTRSHLSALQNCALIFPTNFQFIFTLKKCTTQFSQ